MLKVCRGCTKLKTIQPRYDSRTVYVTCIYPGLKECGRLREGRYIKPAAGSPLIQQEKWFVKKKIDYSGT